MALKFFYFSNDRKIDPKAKELLKNYMAEAIKEIGATPKKKAAEIAETYAASFYKAGKADGVSKDDVKKMEKQVSQDLKVYGLKERVNYAANIKATLEKPLVPYLKVAGAAVIVAGAAMSAAADGQWEMGAGLAGIGLAAAALKAGAYYIGLPNTKAEERKVDEYTDLKHAQLALKQLKRQFRATERAAYKEELLQLFAAGYGQPSGGLVQAAVKRQKSR